MEGLFPFEDFGEDKSKLGEITGEFDKAKTELDETIEAAEKRKVIRLKDLTKGGMLGLSEIELLSELSKMFTAARKLEDLIESLEERVRYVMYTRRIIEIEVGQRGL